MVDFDSPATTLPRPASPRIVVVANQKGGVGKTTTTVNIAHAMALGGLNVLVVDNDPQGNASTALGIKHSPGTKGTYEVLLEGVGIIEHAQPSPHSPNLHVLPAAIDLAAAELELVNLRGREHRMRDAIKQYVDESGVDYIFFDCPPSLGLLTLNALVAANEILVPIQTEYYALEGVTQLMRTIARVKGNLNDDLELSTILLTMYDARTNLSREVADEVRKHFPEQTLTHEIPRSVRIAEAPSYQQTVLNYQPKSPGALAYTAAAREMAERAQKVDE
ncbi:MAG TPA: ParA family protein [Arachnia sp.]|nr:ParA family protein [Arachnia sp.]